MGVVKSQSRNFLSAGTRIAMKPIFGIANLGNPPPINDKGKSMTAYPPRNKVEKKQTWNAESVFKNQSGLGTKN